MKEKKKEKLESPCKNCDKNKMPTCMHGCEKLKEFYYKNFNVMGNHKYDPTEDHKVLL